MILYTIGCPKCNILEKKLTTKGIKFETCNDVKIIKSKNIDYLPVLEIDNQLLSFKEAVDFVNSYKENVE